MSTGSMQLLYMLIPVSFVREIQLARGLSFAITAKVKERVLPKLQEVKRAVTMEGVDLHRQTKALSLNG